MAAGLMVAENTRQTNLSRLRAWLGGAPDGTAAAPALLRTCCCAGVHRRWRRCCYNAPG